MVDPVFAKRTVLSEALCHVLGNTCRIGRTTASYQWNATGIGARGAARCFRDQAMELHDSIESLAEHIRGLGAKAILDYTDRVVAVNPPTADDIPALPQMIENLSEGHVQACISIEAAIDVARDWQDDPSTQILSGRLSAHRRHLWNLTMERPSNNFH